MGNAFGTQDLTKGRFACPNDLSPVLGRYFPDRPLMGIGERLHSVSVVVFISVFHSKLGEIGHAGLSYFDASAPPLLTCVLAHRLVRTGAWAAVLDGRLHL